MFSWAKKLEDRGKDYVDEAMQLLTKTSKGGLIMHPAGQEYLVNQGSILRYEFITSSIEDMIDTEEPIPESTKIRVINETLIQMKKENKAAIRFLPLAERVFQKRSNKKTKTLYVGSYISLDRTNIYRPFDF